MNFLLTIAAAGSFAAFLFFFLRARDLKAQLDEQKDLIADAGALREKAAVTEARKEATDQRLREQQQEFTRMQEQLKLEFRTTATGIFEEISKKFSTQSEKQLGDMLNPLRERIGEFQKKVDESFGAQAKEQYSLKKEIERIIGLGGQLGSQTENLTKALRGDAKVQGNWGEVMLEKILEASGLRKGADYTVQAEGMNLKSDEDERRRPDVIVNLPDGKHVIVDSKVSLVAYERYCAELEEEANALHLKDFLKSVRKHVGDLEGKRYQDLNQIASPDFVLMFMPVEGAYSLAMQQDRDLHAYAWDKRIVIVCPATLFATLKTIASLWRIESQSRHAQEIAREGGALYDKFVGFAEDMLAMGGQIDKLQKTYDQARGKLSEGRGNLVGRAEKLRAMGAKTTKSLPKDFAGEEDASAEESGNVLELAEAKPGK